MKSYAELVHETLDQRAIIDNRNLVQLSDASKSVLIAFNQACEFMRDLHNWKWNFKSDSFLNDLGQSTYPMPYGIVKSIEYQKNTDKNKKCELTYVDELTAEDGCPCQWANKWDTEELQIAPAVSSDCDEISQTIINYYDKSIACIGNRIDGNLLQRFTLDENIAPADAQFLNIPEYIHDAYARCVILKTRVYLNENAQETLFPAQTQEWMEAYNGLMSFAKTPYYNSERTVI
jgi:hypothetical protein